MNQVVTTSTSQLETSSAPVISWVGRAIAIVLALLAGWVIYLIAMLQQTYDGALSLLLQPVMAVACSVISVVLVLILGLFLRIPGLQKAWNNHWWPAVAMIVAGLLVMGFGSALGLTTVYRHPDTGQTFVGIHPAAGLGGYLAMLFGITNWPVAPRR